MTLPPAVRALLWPASLLFEGVVRLRAWLYRRGVFRPQRLRGVVISVGNLTVGGTGKTPMVRWLVARLLAEGKKVGILTRGYRGFGIHGTRGVPSAQLHYHDPEIVYGDEVCLLLRGFLTQDLKVGVGADRYAKGAHLEQQGTEWFLLDDGFQHLALGRDVDLVLVDAMDPFGGGRLLPAGRLREPRSALGRADVVVITRSEHAPAVEAIVRRHTGAPIFYAHTRLEGVFKTVVASAEEPGEADWCGKRLFAFCAIGNPAAFFGDLRGWGMWLVGQALFRDHYRFGPKDMQQLQRRARAAGAEALICSEKDVMNLVNAGWGSLPVWYCEISIAVDGPEEFWRTILDVVQRKRGGAGR